MDQYWIEPSGESGGRWRLGLTEAWLEGLRTGVVGLELLPAGTRLERGEGFGFLHAAEGTHDLRAPRALCIAAVNEAALIDARLVRQSPALRGWLIEFTE